MRKPFIFIERFAPEDLPLSDPRSGRAQAAEGQKPTVRVQTSVISAFVSPSVPLHRSFPHFSKWTWLICPFPCFRGSSPNAMPIGITYTAADRQNPTGRIKTVINLACVSTSVRLRTVRLPYLVSNEMGLADFAPTCFGANHENQ